MESVTDAAGASILTTGASVSYANGYTLYSFTDACGSITFGPGVTTATVLMVGGGGGGGFGRGGRGAGGGGAGSVGTGVLSFLGGVKYEVNVGRGGEPGIPSSMTTASSGGSSSIKGELINEVAYGGGYGGSATDGFGQDGGSQGSGGGGAAGRIRAALDSGAASGGNGTLTYISNKGDQGSQSSGGGGGGAIWTGTRNIGGAGYTWDVNGETYGGGGGGGGDEDTSPSPGGGGIGCSSNPAIPASSGLANTGGGGGGSCGVSVDGGSNGGSGGSGVVIIAIGDPLVPLTASPKFGGLDGANFYSLCPHGEYIVSFGGRGGYWLDSLEITCSGSGSYSAGGQGGGAYPESPVCLQGFTGISTVYGNVVGKYQLLCDGQAWGSPIGLGGGSGCCMSGSYSCPPGGVLVGVVGLAADFVHSLRVVCGGNPPAPVPVPSAAPTLATAVPTTSPTTSSSPVAVCGYDQSHGMEHQYACLARQFTGLKCTSDLPGHDRCIDLHQRQLYLVHIHGAMWIHHIQYRYCYC